ncbi:uncharacterized protein LOC135828662 [Sycon ciliatum]|uniref:uncharacterized protein LOC135828662 n=1 Tax=Sycon ciliatum TaxID=27933 RepID=UPI0031F71289
MPHSGGHRHGGSGAGGRRPRVGAGGFHSDYHSLHHGGGRRCRFPCLCGAFLLVLIFACAIVPIMLLVVVFNERSVDLSPRATRLVTLDTVWNRGVQFSSKGDDSESVKAYILSQRPSIRPRRDNFTMETSALIMWDDSQFWSFNLIPPSSATMTVTTKDNFEFYLIRGDAQFRNWVNRDENNRHNFSIAGYRYTPQHGIAESVVVFNGSVSKEYVYYFVVARDRRITGVTGHFEIRLDVSRSLYDTASLETQCDFADVSMSGCDSPLPFSSQRYALFVAPNSTDMLQTFTPGLGYVPRESMYMGVFGGVSTVLIAMAVLCVRHDRKQRRAMAAVLLPAETVSERAPLINAAAPRDSPLPKYHPLCRNSPPSYSSTDVYPTPPPPPTPADEASPRHSTPPPTYQSVRNAASSHAHIHPAS